MHAQVTLLRKHGLRLSRRQWPEPVSGRLQMVDLAPEHTSFGRHTRALQLMEMVGMAERPAIVLFEPQLLDVTPDAIVFRGIELQAVEGRVFEHQQVWMVAPRQAEA